MRDRRKERGRRAEEAAKRYLEQAGFRVVCANWRCRQGELDLVAWEGKTLVFIEVRSRTHRGMRMGTAMEAVDKRKQQQVRHVATLFLQRLKMQARTFRFDVVAVHFREDGQMEITHLRNAF
jgi:putative endonuclease